MFWTGFRRRNAKRNVKNANLLFRKVKKVIYVTLSNMTSAAPLSVVLTLYWKWKEGKRGRGGGHIWKGFPFHIRRGPFLVWFIFDKVHFWYDRFLIFHAIWNFKWGISEFSLAIILWSFINLLLSSMFQIRFNNRLLTLNRK